MVFGRAVDRLGKGVRTTARDALLSQQATPQTKARVFGFHRSMDTLGAAIGPMIALGLLALFPGSYRTLFLVAFVPGLLSVALIYGVKEVRQPPAIVKRSSFFSFLLYGCQRIL